MAKGVKVLKAGTKPRAPKPPRKFFDVRVRIEGERGELVDRFIADKIEKENRKDKTDAVTAFLLAAAKEWDKENDK